MDLHLALLALRVAWQLHPEANGEDNDHRNDDNQVGNRDENETEL
jgi:hypothetical protein